MKITVTGSLGNISKPLTNILIKAGHQVTVITSSEDRTAEIVALGAIPAVGLITDTDFLTKAFSGAEAVYVMVPPNFGATDWKSYIATIGQNYADAVKAAGVKQVVHLSSVGADQEDGVGPVTGLYRVEQIYNDLEGVHVKHLRAGFFFTNFFANVDMINHAGIIGSNFGPETKIVMVHPNDIAKAAAAELQKDFTGKSVLYVANDVRTAGEVAKVLGTAIHKPELPWVEFSDADNLAGAIQAGLPEEIATNYTEMGAAIRSGKMFEDYFKNQPELGPTKLEDFAVEFAKAF